MLYKYSYYRGPSIQMPTQAFHSHEQPALTNPLARYFRVPGVHVRLPSNGAFMPSGSIDFDMNGTVPVYPMRAADELLLKSPDALMSGYAIEKMIESCAPTIKAPRWISNPDLDTLLLAIRAATYGEVIELNPTCPNCNTENNVHRSLTPLLSTMTMIPSENQVRLSDEVMAYVRPYNLMNTTMLGTASFEETRKVQALETADEETRRKQISQSMERLSSLAIQILADCIQCVVTPDGKVIDPAMIYEFICNIGKDWTDRLQAKLDELNGMGIDKRFEIECHSCGHRWMTSIEFDPATFFAPAS